MIKFQSFITFLLLLVDLSTKTFYRKQFFSIINERFVIFFCHVWSRDNQSNVTWQQQKNRKIIKFRFKMYFFCSLFMEIVSTEHSNTMLGITSPRKRTINGLFMWETAIFIPKHAMWWFGSKLLFSSFWGKKRSSTVQLKCIHTFIPTII